MGFEEGRTLRDFTENLEVPNVPVDKWEQGTVRFAHDSNAAGKQLCTVEDLNDKGAIVRRDEFIEENGGVWRLIMSEREGMTPKDDSAVAEREAALLLREELGTDEKWDERERTSN